MQSKHIKAALEIIAQASTSPLTDTKCQQLAISLAEHLLLESNRTMTHAEKKIQAELARMMEDERGKIFTLLMADRCFRSSDTKRVADQFIYLIKQLGLPRYLGLSKRLALALFHLFGKLFSRLLVPAAASFLRKTTQRVIIPGEAEALSRYRTLRWQQGVRLNLNHIGEAILGEREAEQRLHVYLEDLKREDVEYISIKISTIYSQINLLGWTQTLDVLAKRLRLLYRVALSHTYVFKDGSTHHKFVNLDMEEYRDLHLTVELFMRVLSEPEFFHFSAGIVLQAYLPDSFVIQRQLTEWALSRVDKGGAPIKLRIVKGANLAMEAVESSMRGWTQAPYQHKLETDAQYRRMLHYGCERAHAKAVNLGIGTHNLFDIAYAFLLRAQQKVERQVCFEMLEGMADSTRRVVQQIAGDILLYCPVAKKEDFQNAIAYLIRRLDENTGPENFLRHAFNLSLNSKSWKEQVAFFSQAFEKLPHLADTPRRTQDRLAAPLHLSIDAPFNNEPDTDFSLEVNRIWAERIAAKWQTASFDRVPLVIGGEEIYETKEVGKGYDPARPEQPLYEFCLADWHLVDKALACARENEERWAHASIEKRTHLLSKAAEKMREKRDALIGVMMADGGKTLFEADPEVSEAIDFAEYYLRSLQKMHMCPDIHWKPKGTLLIAPPWNFPISIPTGGILAALAAGNCVLFKPAPEAVLSGWILVNALWDAGIPKEVLQFVSCLDDPIGSRLIADERIAGIILTGATETARLFLRLRPSLDLCAETGGKNALIVTAMADRDLAIRDVVHSAFGHSGQKCSACSLLILEKEVYDDSHFRAQLKDAVESLKWGPCWDLSNKVVPLIHQPNPELKRGLTRLEEGEEWLVKPEQDTKNQQLWSPGVKWGVKEKSFMHRTELFGPVLAVLRADDLEDAIRIANDTPYGLTSGLHSLDEREHAIWLKKIQAGNCYINRGITGAVVRRQPFGGTKASSFGPAAKAGGPSYVMQCAHAIERSLPQEKLPVSEEINRLTSLLKKIALSERELGLWYVSISNYAYWAKHFCEDHDPSKILGQDNILRYTPYQRIAFRMQRGDAILDILRTLAAALSCRAELTVSFDRDHPHLACMEHVRMQKHPLHLIAESEQEFVEHAKNRKFERIRLLSSPSLLLRSLPYTYLAHAPVLANGRFELLHYLREISISFDYHRYGNLGLREEV